MGENEYEIPLNVLSMKDRRILKELFVSARTPFSVIAKKVGLSKEVVNYRVKKLIKSGILLRFNTIIDVNRLGWQIYFVNIKLRNIDNSIEKEIIDTLATHPNIAQVLKCIGNHDLIIKCFVKDYIEINNLMKYIEMKFKKNIEKYSINLVEHEVPIPLPFFYEPFKIEDINVKKDKSLFSVSQMDLQILKALSHNARMSVADIAKQINQSRELVRHHLKKLEKNKIILRYRPSAWSGSKLIGYSWYFVMLKLNEFNKNTLSKLKSYIINHSNMTYYYKTMGQNDIQFEIRLKTSDELNKVLMDIRSILGNELKSHELSIILKEHKYGYFPECLLE